jgi:hypothetical protein
VAGDYLGLAPDRRRVYVLSPSSLGSAQAVAVVSVQTGQLLKRFELPRGPVYRSLTVGPRTGRLYLAANERPEAASSSQREGAAVYVADPGSGRILSVTQVRDRFKYDWRVFSTTVSSDESRLWISYHGTDTTGADSLTIDGLRLRHCASQADGGIACVNLHGRVVAYRRGLLATTGEGPLLEIRANGTVAARYAVQLKADHLTEFALDPNSGRVAVIGPCDYTGGVSVISLEDHRATTFSHPSRRVCGARIAFLDSTHLLLARDSQTSLVGTPSSIVVFDIDSRHITRQISSPTDIVDIVVVR